MSISDVFMLVVRWLHLISAAAWVGGSVFYLVVLRPALRRSPEGSRLINAATASEFRALVETCVYVLIATGVILSLHRLTPGVVGAPYVIVLGAKIALSIWMFALAWTRRKRTSVTEAFREEQEAPTSALGRILRAMSGYNTIVILGLAVFLLSDLLKTLYELALK